VDASLATSLVHFVANSDDIALRGMARASINAFGRFVIPSQNFSSHASGPRHSMLLMTSQAFLHLRL
jgi:hypothetical protein